MEEIRKIIREVILSDEEIENLSPEDIDAYIDFMRHKEKEKKDWKKELPKIKSTTIPPTDVQNLNENYPHKESYDTPLEYYNDIFKIAAESLSRKFHNLTDSVEIVLSFEDNGNYYKLSKIDNPVFNSEIPTVFSYSTNIDGIAFEIDFSVLFFFKITAHNKFEKGIGNIEVTDIRYPQQMKDYLRT